MLDMFGNVADTVYAILTQPNTPGPGIYFVEFTDAAIPDLKTASAPPLGNPPLYGYSLLSKMYLNAEL